MDMNKHLIDFFIDLQNISQRKPLNKCMFCRLNIEKIDFIFNNDKEKIEVKIKCECIKEEKIIEINNLFEEISITQSDDIKKKRSEIILIENNFLYSGVYPLSLIIFINSLINK